MTRREELLDSTIRDLYQAISFVEGGEPDWRRMGEIFLPSGRLTRITPEGVEYFDLPTFQAMAMEMLDQGVYTSFYEHETARRVDLFGGVAHVLSAYETKRSVHAASSMSRGLNSIQLLWTGENWGIVSLFWDEEPGRNGLDLDRLFEGVAHG